MYNLFGYGAEVRTNHIRRIYQRKQALAFSRDECSGATSLHRTQNVPAMRSHEAELPDLDPEAGGNHPVGFGRGLVTLDRIHREVLFKELRQAGICTCCSTAF